MRYIWVALAIGVLVMGCGGGSTGTAGPQDTGRIFVRNDSRAILEVSYVNEEQGLIETTLQPGETKEVSQAELENGTTVKVKIKALSSPDDQFGHYHHQPESEVPLTIQGNVTIRVTGPLVFGGKVPYEIMK